MPWCSKSSQLFCWFVAHMQICRFWHSWRFFFVQLQFDFETMLLLRSFYGAQLLFGVIVENFCFAFYGFPTLPEVCFIRKSVQKFLWKFPPPLRKSGVGDGILVFLVVLAYEIRNYRQFYKSCRRALYGILQKL